MSKSSAGEIEAGGGPGEGGGLGAFGRRLGSCWARRLRPDFN